LRWTFGRNRYDRGRFELFRFFVFPAKTNSDADAFVWDSSDNDIDVGEFLLTVLGNHDDRLYLSGRTTQPKQGQLYAKSFFLFLFFFSLFSFFLFFFYWLFLFSASSTWNVLGWNDMDLLRWLVAHQSSPSSRRKLWSWSFISIFHFYGPSWHRVFMVQPVDSFIEWMDSNGGFMS